jgi:hypothetical protein
VSATKPKPRDSMKDTKKSKHASSTKRTVETQTAELHQTTGKDVPVLTNPTGSPVSDDQYTLRIGSRGPALLEEALQPSLGTADDQFDNYHQLQELDEPVTKGPDTRFLNPDPTINKRQGLLTVACDVKLSIDSRAPGAQRGPSRHPRVCLFESCSGPFLQFLCCGCGQPRTDMYQYR